LQVAEHGGTPLHAAVFGKHVEVVALLLARGADPDLKNKLGLSSKAEAKGDVIDPFTTFKTGGAAALLNSWPKCQELKTTAKKSGSSKTKDSVGRSISKSITSKTSRDKKGSTSKPSTKTTDSGGVTGSGGTVDPAAEKARLEAVKAKKAAEAHRAQEAARQEALKAQEAQKQQDMLKAQEAQRQQLELQRQEAARRQQDAITATQRTVPVKTPAVIATPAPVTPVYDTPVDEDEMELVQARAERDQREAVLRRDFQQHQDAIAQERNIANARAEQANQARMAARAQSEMRRTQQLKIIEGARAKVQSVIDAHSRKQQAFMGLFSDFERNREHYIASGSFTQKEQELSRLETALAAEATAAQTAMAKVHAMEQKFLQVEATRAEDERLQDELEAKRKAEEAEKDLIRDQAYANEENRRRQEEEQWKETEQQIMHQIAERKAARVLQEQEELIYQQQLHEQQLAAQQAAEEEQRRLMEEQMLAEQQQMMAGGDQFDMTALDTVHVINELSSQLGTVGALPSMPMAPPVPGEFDDGQFDQQHYEYEQRMLQAQLEYEGQGQASGAQMTEDEYRAYQQQLAQQQYEAQFESPEHQRQYEEQLLLQQQYEAQFESPEHRAQYEEQLRRQQEYEAQFESPEHQRQYEEQLRQQQEYEAQFESPEHRRQYEEQLLLQQQYEAQFESPEHRAAYEAELLRQQQFDAYQAQFTSEDERLQYEADLQRQEMEQAQYQAEVQQQLLAQQQAREQEEREAKERDAQRLRAEKEQREREEKERAERERIERERAERERERQEKIARENAAREQAAREQALREQQTRETQARILRERQAALGEEGNPPPSAARNMFEKGIQDGKLGGPSEKPPVKAGSVSAMIAAGEARAAAADAQPQVVKTGRKWGANAANPEPAAPVLQPAVVPQQPVVTPQPQPTITSQQPAVTPQNPGLGGVNRTVQSNPAQPTGQFVNRGGPTATLPNYTQTNPVQQPGRVGVPGVTNPANPLAQPQNRAIPQTGLAANPLLNRGVSQNINPYATAPRQTTSLAAYQQNSTLGRVQPGTQPAGGAFVPRTQPNLTYGKNPTATSPIQPQAGRQIGTPPGQPELGFDSMYGNLDALMDI